jgi:hypothetical protein
LQEERKSALASAILHVNERVWKFNPKKDKFKLFVKDQYGAIEPTRLLLQYFKAIIEPLTEEEVKSLKEE